MVHEVERLRSMPVPRPLGEVKPLIDRAFRTARVPSLMVLGLSLVLAVAFGYMAVKTGSWAAGAKTFLGVGLLTSLPGLLFWRRDRRDLTRLFCHGTLVSGVVESLCWTSGKHSYEGAHAADQGCTLYALISYALPSSGALGVVQIVVPSHDNVPPDTDALVLVDAGAPRAVVVFAPGEADGSLGLYYGNPRAI